MAKETVIVDEESGIPLIGTIMFGIVDRGTNLLQIRTTTKCPLNCIFCSVDSGEKTKTRQADFVVDMDYMIKWIEEVVKFKGGEVEANIDSVGEAMSYPGFVELVKKIKNIEGVGVVSMQTNGFFLSKENVDELEKAGVNRINLSINSLDIEKAKLISGCSGYNIGKIMEISEYIAKSKIELLLAPVFMSGFNDEDIKDIIKFAKKIGAKLGIQKYEVYKYSRKVKGVKLMNWWKFYKRLEEWEKEYDVKLVLKKEDMDIKKCKRLETVFEVGDKVMAEIKCKGWLNGQMIGAAENRAITINNCDKEIGKSALVKIVENKNNLYIAEVIK